MFGFLVILCVVALARGDVDPGPRPPCPSDNSIQAYFASKDCTKFWQCSNGVPYLMPCAPGTHWSQELWTCVHIVDSTCTGEGWSTTTKAPTTTTTTTTTPKPTTTTPKPTTTTTEKPSNERTTTAVPRQPPTHDTEAPGTCPPVDGPDSVYFPDADCSKFWQCSNGVAHQHSCADGLHFNPDLNVCDWPERAGCNGTATTEVTNSSTSEVETTTSSANTTSSGGAPGTCPPVDGPNSVYFPDPDCTKFWQCSNGVPYQHSCADGLHFNPDLNVCDWPDRAGCNGTATTEATNSSTSEVETTTPSANTTSSGEAPGACPPVDGPDSVYFPDPDCTKFWQCSNGVAHQHSCADGLHFNPDLNVCDWPERAGCNGTATTEVTNSPTSEVETTTPSANTTSSGEAPRTCPPVDGPDSVYFPDPDCTKFWQCSNGVAHQHSCADGLHFNPDLNVCDWPERAGCNGTATTEVTNSSTSDVETTTPSANTTSSGEAPGRCPPVDSSDSVYFPDPDCTKFWQCSNGVPYQHSCADGLHFNPDLNVCDWPERAGCNGTATTEVTNSSTSEVETTTSSANTTSSGEEPEIISTTPEPVTTTQIDDTTTESNKITEATTAFPANSTAPGVCPPVDGPDSVYFPDPDCTKFWQCSNGVAHQHSCADGLHFNPDLNVCDWPESAGCNGTAITDVPTTTTGQEETTTSSVDTTTSNEEPEISTTPEPDTPTDDQTPESNKTTEVTTASPTTATAPGECPPVDGPDSVYFPDADCTKFWQCSNGVPYQQSCPDGLHFNPILIACDWPERAGCNGTASTEVPTTTNSDEETTTASAETTTSSEAPGRCPPVDGPNSVYFPDADCTKFWQCSNGVAHQQSCPDGLHFNPILIACDWPERAGCNGTASTEVPTTTNSDEETTTASAETTTSSDAPGKCPPVDGPNSVYFPDADCTKFWQCSNGVPYQHSCADGLHFNPDLNVCDWPKRAGCNGTASTEVPTTTNSDEETKTASAETTTSSEAPGECPSVDGPNSVYFPDADCTKFWQCSNGVPYQHSCADGLHFNPDLNVCDWPERAGCNGTASTEVPTTTNSNEETTTASAETTTSSEAPGECPPVDGPNSVYFPDADCTKFWQCSNGVPYQQSCPDGLHFNPDLNVCDWPERAGCNGTASTEVPATTNSDEETTTASAETTTSSEDISTTPEPDTTTQSDDQTPESDKTTEVTSSSPTTATAPGECPPIDGPESVYFPDPDCSKFWQCSNGVAHQQSCADGLHFNPDLNVCDWPNRAGCNGTASTELPTTTTSGEQTEHTTSSAETTTPSDDDESTTTEVTTKVPVVTTTLAPPTTTENIPSTTPACKPPPTRCTCTCELVPEDEPTTTSIWTSSPSTVHVETTSPEAASHNSSTPSGDLESTTSRGNPETTVSTESTVVQDAENTTTTAKENVETTVSTQATTVADINGTIITAHDYDDSTGSTEGTVSDVNNTTTTENVETTASSNHTFSDPSTTKAESNTTTQAPPPSGQDSCNELSSQCPAVDGPDSVYIPLAECTGFCQCSNGRAYYHPCPAGLHFNPTLNVCDYPDRAGCTGVSGTTTTTTPNPVNSESAEEPEPNSLGGEIKQFFRKIFS